MNEKKNKPIQKFRCSGVTASIWENENIGKNNQEIKTYSITLQRAYKDDFNEEWHTTNSLGIHDLPKALLVLQEAYKFLALKNVAGE